MSATTATSERREQERAGIADPGKESRAGEGIPIVPAMDGFRAFAILAIVLLHVQGVIIIPGSDGVRELIGTFGKDLVSILFVLSGFVVFLPTVARRGDPGSLGAFFIRRGARLLPAYWVALAFTFAMLVLWPGVNPPMPGAGNVAVNLGVLQSPAHLFDPGSGFSLFGFGINGPLWTLSIEIAFYLVLPLVASTYFRHPFAGLAAAALLVIAWRVAFANLAPISDLLGLGLAPGTIYEVRAASINQFPAFALHFASGMTAAYLYVRLRETLASGELRRLASRLQLLSLLTLGALAAGLGYVAATTGYALPEFDPLNEVIALSYAVVLAAFMLATSLAPPRRQAPFALPFARRAGDVSYGIYLIHAPLLFYLVALLAPTPNTIGGVITVGMPAIAIATAYGYLSARVIEQPIRRWAHRFGRRSAPAVPPLPEPRHPQRLAP